MSKSGLNPTLQHALELLRLSADNKELLPPIRLEYAKTAEGVETVGRYLHKIERDREALVTFVERISMGIPMTPRGMTRLMHDAEELVSQVKGEI